MIEYLLAADLLILTLLLAHISFHCIRMRIELPVLAESATGTTAEIIEIMNEGGAILSDIAEILEGTPTTSAPSPAGMPNIPELLLNALMSKTAMSSSHGEETSKESGPLYEEEPKPKEKETSD